MSSRPTSALFLPLCAALLGSCDAEDDPQADLAEFRSEIGEVGLSRVVIARMYQGPKWIVEDVPASAPVADKVKHVCDAIKPLLPTYVSGLVRLDATDDIAAIEDMKDVFAGVKSCVRDHVLAKTGRKVRFDVVLNALHYTAETKGVTDKSVGLGLLEARVASANAALKPDGYFFDFFSDPWVVTPEEGEDYHPDALADGIKVIQKQGRFVGGNMLRTFTPPGADFMAFTDRGGGVNVHDVVDRLAKQNSEVPMLLHIRNDPHCRGSEGRLYVGADRPYRKRQLRRHVKWADQFGLTYMYPVFFPLYSPNFVETTDCDHPKPDHGDKVHAGFVFDASLDGNLLDRMKEYLGPAPKKGELLKKQKLSNLDAMPTAYDADDDGLIAVHRADDALGGHHYAISLYELEVDAGLDVTAEGYFSLAPTQGPGTAPLYGCELGAGRRLLTTDPACEGLGASGGALGFIGASALAGTVPLHRLARGEPLDILYTTSPTERGAALAGGFGYGGVDGHVWDELGYAVLDEPEPEPEPEPAPEPDPMDPPPEPEPPCSGPRTPVYRGYHTVRKQHLFAVDHDELLVPNMTDEGAPFQLRPGEPAFGWAPLYRCLLPKSWHMLTRSPGCEGAANAIQEGVLGNIATVAQPGTLPVRRYFRADPDGNDYVYVLGAECVDIPNFTCEGILGYVGPP